MTPSDPRPRLDPDEDRRLVERCLAGEAAAWEALVRRHERLVYAIGRSYRLDDADLGDLFQEVFSALVRGLPRLRESRALVRWLSSTSERIARAIALRRRRELARSVAIDDPDRSGPTLESPGEAPGEQLERLEQQALVRLALADLGDRCRVLIEALFYEDPTPSYTELSRRLGMPIGSLGPTRARCFERLRAGWERLAGTGAGINPGGEPTSPPERPPGTGSAGTRAGRGRAGDTGGDWPRSSERTR